MGVCPPLVCDGFTCLCHQGSSIIAINLLETGPAHGLLPPRESEPEEKDRGPPFPPPYFTSPPLFWPHQSTSPTPPQTKQKTHLRRVCKKEKKSLKTVMFVSLHTRPLFFFYCSHMYINTHTVCTPQHFFAGCNDLHTNRKQGQRRRTNAGWIVILFNVVFSLRDFPARFVTFL